ncbi:Uncharacterised protein [uncultured archaeon]|nr:Uncharacterised protein [uncultured archaeon]
MEVDVQVTETDVEVDVEVDVQVTETDVEVDVEVDVTDTDVEVDVEVGGKLQQSTFSSPALQLGSPTTGICQHEIPS